MKKLLFLLSVAALSTTAFAQPVPLTNGDFENWTSTSYDNPDMPWFHSNDETIPYYGKVSVKKTAGFSGSHAIRLENVEDGFDTTAGYITNSLTDIENGEGGVPFTFQATSLKGTYRYNLTTGDTAVIYLIFKKNAQVISYNTYKITGSQATATQFNYAVSAMGQAPDSMIIAVLSGNALNGTPKMGSWIELDELFFDDGSLAVPVNGGDFENWTTKSLDEPDAWVNTDLGEISKSTDKYSGTYAAKLVSKDDGTGYIDAAALTLGSATQQMGMPFTKKVDTLTGYYKYSTSGTDNGNISITLVDGNGMPLGQAIDYQLSPVGSYTYFEVPISSTTTPARIIVDIESSDYSGNPVDGSTLYIDELKLKNSPTSIGDVSNNEKQFVVYPNPVQNTLHIKQMNSQNTASDVYIYNISGKLMFAQTFTQKEINIPVTDFATGMYQYIITSGEHTSRGKFVKK